MASSRTARVAFARVLGVADHTPGGVHFAFAMAARFVSEVPRDRNGGEMLGDF